MKENIKMSSIDLKDYFRKSHLIKDDNILSLYRCCSFVKYKKEFSFYINKDLIDFTDEEVKEWFNFVKYVNIVENLSYSEGKLDNNEFDNVYNNLIYNRLPYQIVTIPQDNIRSIFNRSLICEHDNRSHRTLSTIYKGTNEDKYNYTINNLLEHKIESCNLNHQDLKYYTDKTVKEFLDDYNNSLEDIKNKLNNLTDLYHIFTIKEEKSVGHGYHRLATLTMLRYLIFEPNIVKKFFECRDIVKDDWKALYFAEFHAENNYNSLSNKNELIINSINYFRNNIAKKASINGTYLSDRKLSSELKGYITNSEWKKANEFLDLDNIIKYKVVSKNLKTLYYGKIVEDFKNVESIRLTGNDYVTRNYSIKNFEEV